MKSLLCKDITIQSIYDIFLYSYTFLNLPQFLTVLLPSCDHDNSQPDKKKNGVHSEKVPHRIFTHAELNIRYLTCKIFIYISQYPVIKGRSHQYITDEQEYFLSHFSPLRVFEKYSVFKQQCKQK